MQVLKLHFCAEVRLVTFKMKSDMFWRQLCLLFGYPLSLLWGHSGLSPKLLAGMLNFGNGLKAELKEGFLWLTVGGKQGKPSAAGRRREGGFLPSSGIRVVERG